MSPLEPLQGFQHPRSRFELGRQVKYLRCRRVSGAESVDNMATATQVCSLENYLVLPDNTMDERIAAAREALGRDCVILGHHYQRDEVIRFADFRGDSYKLSQQAAQAGGKYIVFCGVHFMAESADILAGPGRSRFFPISMPAAPWPTWPRSPRWKTAGSSLVRAGSDQ